MRLTTLLAVLLALAAGAALYPVFAPARPPSCGIRLCPSRLRTLAVAMLMYGSDFDDRLPPHAAWIDATAPYTKNMDLYHCPQAHGPWGYAFSAALGGARLSDGDAPMLYDSTSLVRNASDPATSLPNPGRHDGTNNMAYADGHVRAVRP